MDMFPKLLQVLVTVGSGGWLTLTVWGEYARLWISAR